MAKTASRRRQKQPTRKQISRREKERRTTQMLVVGTSVVLCLVVLILGWGLYDQYVLQPSKPVATVAGVPIRVDTYQRLVKYRRWDYRNYLSRLESQKLQIDANDDSQSFFLQYIDQQIEQLQSEITDLPTSVLEELIDDQIVRQESERRGIMVSSEEVEIRLEEQFGYDRNPPTPTPITVTLPITVTPTPTVAPMTHEEFVEQSAGWLQIAQEATGFSEKDFLSLLEVSLYREKLEEALNAEVPTTAEQIHARHVLVETREEAEDALARLHDGEGFAELAAELSTDTTSGEEGGDLGWFARGKMVTEFEEAAFALEPGQLSEIVETQYGFHIIEVVERDANRELELSDLEAVQWEAFNSWFEARRESEDVVRYWKSSMVPKDT